MIAPNPNPPRKHSHGPADPHKAHAHRHDHKKPHRHDHPHDHDHDHDEVHGQNRGLGSMLAEGVAGQAHHIVTSKASDLIKNQIFMFIAPIRNGVGLVEALPVVGSVVKTFENWLATNLQAYIDRTGINFGMPVDQAIDKLLRGDIDQFSDEFANGIFDFAKSVIPQNLVDSFRSMNPMKIASALSSTMGEHVEALKGHVEKTNPKGNFFVNALRTITNFIPFANRLPEWTKPWIGGGVGFLGLSFLWRMTKGLFKLALIGGAALLGWQFFMGGKKAEPQST